MTPSIADVAGGKSQQFAILKIENVFNFYQPKPPLSEFVDNLWLFEGDGAERAIERVLPTGTLELAINLRENELGFHALGGADNCSRFSGAVVSGPHGRAFVPAPAEKILIIGVHFKPGGAFPFLGLPTGELTDTHVDLESLWGSAAGRLRERLIEARSSAKRFLLLEEALLARFRRGAQRHYAVSAALEMLGKHQAGTTVKEAARHLGLSQRRFIQVFRAEVGLTPKLFSRIQRFQRTRFLIHQNTSLDWAGLAADLGYFDQSHFIREFVEFSGFRPTDYLNRHKSLIDRDRDENDNHPESF